MCWGRCAWCNVAITSSYSCVNLFKRCSSLICTVLVPLSKVIWGKNSCGLCWLLELLCHDLLQVFFFCLKICCFIISVHLIWSPYLQGRKSDNTSESEEGSWTMWLWNTNTIFISSGCLTVTTTTTPMIPCFFTTSSNYAIFWNCRDRCDRPETAYCAPWELWTHGNNV